MRSERVREACSQSAEMSATCFLFFFIMLCMVHIECLIHHVVMEGRQQARDKVKAPARKATAAAPYKECICEVRQECRQAGSVIAIYSLLRLSLLYARFRAMSQRVRRACPCAASSGV